MSSTFHRGGDQPGEDDGGQDRRADPAYAAELGLVTAPIGRRAGAFVIDLLGYLVVWSPGIAAVVIGAASAVQGRPVGVPAVVLLSVGTALATVYVLVQLILHGRRGVTIGKALTGIRSVNVVTYERPGFWRVVLRGLVWYLSGVIVPVLGAVVVMASAWWGERNRGWLDRIGSTWLVDARTGVNPYDAKAMRLAKKRVDAPVIDEAAPVPSLATGADALTDLAARSRSRSSVVGHASVFTLAGTDDAASAPLIPQPPVAPEVAADVPTPVPAAVLVGDDGSTVPVGEWAVVGRAPALRSGEAGAQLIAIEDPAMSLSKTHAAVGVDERGLWIEDRGSSNGTTIGEPDAEREVPVGVRMRVPWGSRLTLGSRSYRALERRIDG